MPINQHDCAHLIEHMLPKKYWKNVRTPMFKDVFTVHGYFCLSLAI